MNRQILDLLGRLPGHEVTVVGDVMLDEYLMGNTRRVSPEAPVLVVDVESMSWAPGGAANVAANICALGGKACIIGVIGMDDAGRRLRQLLDSLGVDTGGLVEDPSRHTTLKTRIIAGNQQVVRVDRERREHPDTKVHRELKKQIQTALQSSGAVVTSDYDKGIVGQITLDTIKAARAAGKIFTSNPKPRNLRWFHRANVITLNQFEAEAASGDTIADEVSAEKAGARIMKRTEADTLIITRGAHGMSVFTRGEAPEHIPVMPVEVYDVAGAGDTVVSTLTLAMAAGADALSAARLANFAGASVVRKLGVATADPQEIAHLIEESSEANGEAV